MTPTSRRPGRTLIAAALLVPAIFALAACTHTSSGAADSAPATPSAANSVPAGLAGGEGEQSSAPRSTIITTPTPKLSAVDGAAEKDGTCPYISNAAFQSGEGDTVGRVTVIQTKPVGCRFYFAFDETQIIGEVLVQQFTSPTAAFNAVALAGQKHPEVQSEADLGDGAVAYRTELQGEATWQCVVALGNRAYTVRTRQTNTSKDAFDLGSSLVKTVRASTK
jgi:hypothetical protein